MSEHIQQPAVSAGGRGLGAQVPERPRLGPLFVGSSWIMRVGLVVMLTILTLRVPLYVWMGVEFDDLVANADHDTVAAVAEADRTAGLVLLGLFPIVGISWMVWQQQLAKSVDPVIRLRRAPAWHAWSWVIPIANFWMPFQNVRDLWQGLCNGRSLAPLRIWWASLFVLWFLSQVVTNQWDDIGSVGDVQRSSFFAAAAFVAFAAAVGLALHVVRTLTVAADRPLADLLAETLSHGNDHVQERRRGRTSDHRTERR